MKNNIMRNMLQLLSPSVPLIKGEAVGRGIKGWVLGRMLIPERSRMLIHPYMKLFVNFSNEGEKAE